MNPKEFWWEEDQNVTVTNPTSKPYSFKVHNKDYMVQSGRTAKMPGFIAWNYVYGLASLICQADSKWNRWNEEGFRRQYYEKLVAGVDDVVQQVTVAPEPEVTDLSEGQEPFAAPAEVKRGRPAKN